MSVVIYNTVAARLCLFGFFSIVQTISRQAMHTLPASQHQHFLSAALYSADTGPECSHPLFWPCACWIGWRTKKLRISHNLQTKQALRLRMSYPLHLVCCNTCGVGSSQSEVDQWLVLELQRLHRYNMGHTYYNNGCFMPQHDVMNLSSVPVNTSKLKKSGNSTTFFFWRKALTETVTSGYKLYICKQRLCC